MSLRVGIVGLPNVGKSTLFNALLKKRVALSANYPFATVEPNIGVVAVPDDRLIKLAELVKSEEKMDSLPPIVPAVVEFVDIAGLVKGASTGEGLGNQFLSHIREVDAIIHVLRDFEDPSVVRAGAENPDADKLTVETELGLADLQTLEKLVAAQEKEAKVAKDALESEKLQILKQVQDDLSGGQVVSGQFHIGDERLRDWFEHLPLLSLKPTLYVRNVDEDNLSSVILGSTSTSLSTTPESDSGPDSVPPSPKELRLRRLNETSPGKQARMTGGEDELVICAKLEEELADLSEEERMEYLKSVGLEETGLERLIKAAYSLLGLISFLTAGKKEVRAWTIKAGTKAPQSAGVIHTDFEKGFIRAQVIEYGKLLEAGSYGSAKQKGWIRTEGKDYQIKDGDVVEFLVSN